MNSFFQKALILFAAISVLVSCTEDDNYRVNTIEEDAELTAELILDWNNLWLELDRYAAGMRPTATARSLAYIHLASYETATPYMDGYISNESRLENLFIDQTQRPVNINLNLALNSCYASVVDYFMYTLSNDFSTRIDVLESNNETELESGLAPALVENSKNWGRYIAQQIIAYSETDVNAVGQIFEPQPFSYEPPAADGYWTFSADEERALFPYWGNVRTFVISSEETSSVPPMIYSNDGSSPYYAQMMEVYEINNEAREEQNENLWIAEYWSNDVEGLMMSPPGRQFSIAGQLVEQYGLDYQETLALFLKLGFSLNDAAVSAWADKYEHMVMRPSVFIEDYIDPDYETNLYRLIFWPNPSFPGYPSGHAAFASAAGGLFINEFGDATDFTDRTHEGRTEFQGAPRQFDSFSEMAVENAYSRLPLGVHIRMDCDEGIRLGYEISDAVNAIDLVQ